VPPCGDDSLKIAALLVPLFSFTFGLALGTAACGGQPTAQANAQAPAATPASNAVINRTSAIRG
jgi:hypothetical protein